MKKEQFGSTWGLIVSLLALAIGTGNIWRFPRVVALNGGGSFLIAYLIGLFAWAIPIILIEFSCGKKYEKGVFAVFSQMLGKHWGWMGAFVVFCTLGIMFYYSVVVGWCLKYFTLSFSGNLLSIDAGSVWTQFTINSWEPLFFHVLCISGACFVVLLGVIKGIERVNLFVMPLFFLILIGLALFAINLPNASVGLDFLFYTDWSKLLNARTWIEALSQAAWSTGAGWGIILSYAAYSHSKEDPLKHSFTTGFGDSSAALLASVIILATLFSALPEPEALSIAGSGNTGLTFISLPHIFQDLAHGRILSTFFFLSLFCAAFTSLVSMIELGSHFLRDFGVKRSTSVFFMLALGLVIGAPSAININFLNNQDWVWGLGLLLSGLFFAILVHRFGIESFMSEMLPNAPKLIKNSFIIIVKWVIPLEFILLLTWWGFQSINDNPGNWWHPFGTYSISTCLFQWGIAILLLVWISPRLIKRIKE